MSDPYAEGLARIGDAIDRLKTEQAKDAVLVERRIATLETIPRSLDELRQKIEEIEGTRLTKEQVKDAVKLAIQEHLIEELQDEAKGPSRGTLARLRSDDRKSRRLLWAKVIGGIVALAVAGASVYSTVKVAQIHATKETKKEE